MKFLTKKFLTVQNLKNSCKGLIFTQLIFLIISIQVGIFGGIALSAFDNPIREKVYDDMRDRGMLPTKKVTVEQPSD